MYIYPYVCIDGYIDELIITDRDRCILYGCKPSIYVWVYTYVSFILKQANKQIYKPDYHRDPPWIFKLG